MGISGVDQVINQMKLIGQNTSAKEMRKASRKAMVPVLADMRSNAPRGSETHKTHKGRSVFPGFLRRNLKIKSKAGRKSFIAWSNIITNDEAWYGWLLERGFRGGRRSKAVKAAGRKGALSDEALDKLGDKRNKFDRHKGWASKIFERRKREVLAIYQEEMRKRIREAAR